jgi:hypothetical protein
MSVEAAGFEPATPPPQSQAGTPDAAKTQNPLAHSLARETQKSAGLVALDPDLQRVLDAWPTLPEAIRRAILALVDAAG